MGGEVRFYPISRERNVDTFNIDPALYSDGLRGRENTMTKETLSYKTRDNSGISGDITLTREEVRTIKKLVEQHMIEHDDYQYRLGGENWCDLDNLRTKTMHWLVRNQ